MWLMLLVVVGMDPPTASRTLRDHHLRPRRPGKTILGDLGIENGKLRMENY